MTIINVMLHKKLLEDSEWLLGDNSASANLLYIQAFINPLLVLEDRLSRQLTRCRGLHQEISVRLSRGKHLGEGEEGRASLSVIPVAEPTC